MQFEEILHGTGDRFRPDWAVDRFVGFVFQSDGQLDSPRGRERVQGVEADLQHFRDVRFDELRRLYRSLNARSVRSFYTDCDGPRLVHTSAPVRPEWVEHPVQVCRDPLIVGISRCARIEANRETDCLGTSKVIMKGRRVGRN